MNMFIPLHSFLKSLRRQFGTIANSKKKESGLVIATIKELSKKGIKRGDSISIRFLFIGEDEQNSENLFQKLSREHQYNKMDSSKIGNQWIISGWTNPLVISLDSLREWRDKMQILAATYNFELVGWGTNV